MSIRRTCLWDPALLPAPLQSGTGRTAVRLELTAHGRDLVLHVGGGEAHVGAVAVAEPGRPAMLTVVPGHKEGPLAAEAAATLAAAADCVCTVIAGIHQDDATGQEIAAIVVNVNEGVTRLAGALQELRRTRT